MAFFIGVNIIGFLKRFINLELSPVYSCDIPLFFIIISDLFFDCLLMRFAIVSRSMDSVGVTLYTGYSDGGLPMNNDNILVRSLI